MGSKKLGTKEKITLQVQVQMEKHKGSLIFRNDIGAIETREGSVQITSAIPTDAIVMEFPNGDQYIYSPLHLIVPIMESRKRKAPTKEPGPRFFSITYGENHRGIAFSKLIDKYYSHQLFCKFDNENVEIEFEIRNGNMMIDQTHFVKIGGCWYQHKYHSFFYFEE